MHIHLVMELVEGFHHDPLLDLEFSLAKNKPEDADFHKKSLMEANASQK